MWQRKSPDGTFTNYDTPISMHMEEHMRSVYQTILAWVADAGASEEMVELLQHHGFHASGTAT